jgi:hypothetical protein
MCTEAREVFCEEIYVSGQMKTRTYSYFCVAYLRCQLHVHSSKLKVAPEIRHVNTTKKKTNGLLTKSHGKQAILPSSKEKEKINLLTSCKETVLERQLCVWNWQSDSEEPRFESIQ